MEMAINRITAILNSCKKVTWLYINSGIKTTAKPVDQLKAPLNAFL